MPWCLHGFFVLNLIGAMAIGSVFHPQLSPAQRVENAVCAFICLDLGRMVAAQASKRLGFRKGSNWLAPQTHECLQSLCGLVCIAAMGLPGDMPWCPQRATELGLEHHFGALRKQFNSSQMRCRDYLFASAKIMAQVQAKGKQGFLVHDDARSFPQPVSDAEFQQCAQRALPAALKLMACCSEPLGPAAAVG